MYALINRHASQIVDAIPSEYISEYEWLTTHLHEAKSSDYQKKYRKYWAMNAAQLGQDFYVPYFELLGSRTETMPSLEEICHRLYECSARRNGNRSIQFSFSTKLLHMKNPRLPIFDSYVASFYFFQSPDSNAPPDERIKKLVSFHQFLIREYERVQREGFLKTATQLFSARFNNHHFSTEKVIDSLIWQTADSLRKGALTEGRVHYC